MASPILVFSLFYFLMSICFMYPPSEFISAGLTVESLFSPFLGDEYLTFIQYHITRSLLTMVAHSLLPFGYLIGYLYLSEENIWQLLGSSSLVWQAIILLISGIPLVVGAVVLYWWKDDFKDNPIVQNLRRFANVSADLSASAQWRSVASDINSEFRRIDKFCHSMNAVTTVVVTDNWIIKSSPYFVSVAHQSDTALVVIRSDLHYDASAMRQLSEVQYLTLEVRSARPGVLPFTIRLKSEDFKDLEAKLTRPVTVLQNIKIHRTLTDRFLEVFKEQVHSNPVYYYSNELEPCMGCNEAPSSVKLCRQCDENSTNALVCGNCFCRPMWCFDCMGKWFVSRQNESEPSQWLSAKCHCPMCRTPFCLLDVCPVVASEN